MTGTLTLLLCIWCSAIFWLSGWKMAWAQMYADITRAAGGLCDGPYRMPEPRDVIHPDQDCVGDRHKLPIPHGLIYCDGGRVFRECIEIHYGVRAV